MDHLHTMLVPILESHELVKLCQAEKKKHRYDFFPLKMYSLEQLLFHKQ